MSMHERAVKVLQKNADYARREADRLNGDADRRDTSDEFQQKIVRQLRESAAARVVEAEEFDDAIAKLEEES